MYIAIRMCSLFPKVTFAIDHTASGAESAVREKLKEQNIDTEHITNSIKVIRIETGEVWESEPDWAPLKDFQ